LHLRRSLSIAIALFAVRGFAQTAVGPEAAPPQSTSARAARPLRLAETATLEPLATLAPATTVDAARVEQMKAARRRDGRRQRGFLREFAPRAIDLAATPAAQSNGSVVWTGKVTVAGAFALRAGLSAVELPPQTRLFVYAPGSEAIGFGLEMKSPQQELWCPAVPGDTVILEVQVPAAAIERGEHARFTLRGVIEEFAFESEKGQVEASEFSDCEVDPTCLDSAFWEDLGGGFDPRKAIAYLEFVENGNSYICSGGLLNNRPTGFPAYLLTAHHCFGTQDAASSLVAYFDYDTPFCGGTTLPWFYPSTTGSTLLATNEDIDFTFVQLSGTVPSDDGRVYLGWSAQELDPDTALYRLHHPGGGPLSYSATTVEDVPAYSCPTRPASHYIHSTGLFGATIGGSSGSPVFLDGGYVVGQLYGVCGIQNFDPCDYSEYSELDGRFSLTYYEIYPWLDPKPQNLVATAQSATSVGLTWSGVSDVSQYKVWRYDGTQYTSVGTASQASFTDSTAQAGKAYLYCVQTLVNGGTSLCSNEDLATTVVFTTDPLVAGSTKILATHLGQVRTAANAVRTLAGLSTTSFSGGTSGSMVKATDITSVRTALDAGMSALGLATGGWTTSSLLNTPVRAVQFQEIRNRVK
jgi:hypothetical protein